jgi:hypothetical protein
MKDGLGNQCASCSTARSKAYNLRAGRDGYLRRTYGIGLKEYEMMLDDQDGCCAICSIGPDVYEERDRHSRGAKGRLYVDHDHATGEVRGLLCMQCNFLLGSASDDVEILEHAIRYLRK